MQGLGHEVAVVAKRYVAAGCELEGGVDGHFLAGGLTVGFSPFQLARVTLHLEVAVAF